MILCVNLNAAVDRTLVVENFTPGLVHRVREVRSVPGGKGANVAKVVACLGRPVTGTGFSGGATGASIRQALAALGVRDAYVQTAGESRTCYNVLDAAHGTQTELLEPGPVITPAEWAAFRSHFRRLAAEARVVTFSGSLPKGLDPSAYQELIRLARETGAMTILDSSGEALRQGLEAEPSMVKPNQSEAEALLGGRIESPAEAAAAARRLLRGETALAVISLGDQGAVVAGNPGDGDDRWAGHTGGATHAWLAVPPVVPIANPVGCGDALVAGFAIGLAEGLGLEETARLATAMAAAKAERPVPGECDPAEVQRLAPLVQLKPMAI